MQCPCLKDFSGIQPLPTSHSWLRGHLYVLHTGWYWTQSCSLYQRCSSLFWPVQCKTNALPFLQFFLLEMAIIITHAESRAVTERHSSSGFDLQLQGVSAVPWRLDWLGKWMFALTSHTNYLQDPLHTSFTLKVSDHKSVFPKHTRAKPGGNFDIAAVALVWYNTHNYFAK